MARSFPRLKMWQWALLAASALLAVAAVFLVLRRYPMAQIVEQLREHGPGPFFAAMAVLPAFGAPVAPFYLVAGAAFGKAMAVPGCLAAVAVNIALSYVMARWLLRPVAERLMRRFGYRIPVVRAEDNWQVTILVRITPGLPFFAQSYLLGLARVPFGIYMAGSVAVSWVLGAAFVVFADGIRSGGVAQIIVGVCFVVAAILGVRFARRALQRRAAESADAPGADAPVAEEKR